MSRCESGRGIAAIAAIILIVQACSGAPEPRPESREPPDFRSLLAAVAQQQKIEIVWANGPYRYEYTWGGGSAEDPAEHDVARVAEAIARELRLYPAGFLRGAGFDAVVLVRDLQVTEDGGTRGAAGYIFGAKFFLDVPSAQRAIQMGTRVRFIHHVIWHQLDERRGTMWTDPEWMALNPPGFEYGVYSRGGVHESRAGAGSLSTQYPGFLNLYSTGNLPDDKAEVFAYLMVIHGWMQERARQDPYLQRKVQIVRARLAALDRRFNADFWARIDAESDEAARYGSPRPVGRKLL